MAAIFEWFKGLFRRQDQTLKHQAEGVGSNMRGGGLRALLWNYRWLVRGLLFLIVAIFLSELRMSHWEASILLKPDTYLEICKDIGVAFIIAFFISMGVERSAKREFNLSVNERMKEIQRQVFLSTYGRHVPSALIDEVEQLVLQADFIRHEHRLTYNLEFVSAHGFTKGAPNTPDIPIVVAEVNMTYEVENISVGPKAYTVILDLEIPPFLGLKEFVKFRNIDIDGRALSASEIESCLSRTNSNLNFSKKIDAIRPNTRVRVKGTWQAIKSADDVELWRCVLPSDGLTLCVRFPKEVKEKGASALHRTPLLEQTAGDGNYQEWSIRGGVLPYQGIVFWWRCSNPPLVGALGPEPVGSPVPPH